VTVERKEKAVNGSRPYRSPVREAQARQTRRKVVAAARELFVERGYAATSIPAVAERAGVSTDTVFKRFGSKIALLREVLDVVVGGDDADVPLLERADPEAMRHEPDQHRQVRMFAAGMTEQLERLGPLDAILRSAAAVDTEAAALRNDVQLRQRRQAMHAVVGWIAAHGGLRAGMTQDDAAAAVWTLTSPEVHAMLRGTCGWPSTRYRQWLDDMLTATLLVPPGPPRGPDGPDGPG
jgi:AcrR family transcriptional regulator